MRLTAETRQNIGVLVGNKVAVSVIDLHAFALIKVAVIRYIFVVVAKGTAQRFYNLDNAT